MHQLRMNITPEHIFRSLTIPPEHTLTPVRDGEALYLYELLRALNSKRTLEVGMGLGKSAAFIMASTGEPHVAIDPFQANFANGGLRNIDQLGLTKNLEFYSDFSHNVLPKLLASGREFDFVFVDGSHRHDGIFIDFYYADLLIPQNGVIVFHDTWMRSTQLVLSFIKTNRQDYEQLPTNQINIAIVRKVGTDNRDGMHFREFYTFRFLIRYNISIWLGRQRDSMLKRSLIRAKELIRRFIAPN